MEVDKGPLDDHFPLQADTTTCADLLDSLVFTGHQQEKDTSNDINWHMRRFILYIAV